MQNSKSQTYENGRVAVDPVIFTIKDQRLLVYLNPREKDPYMGFLELPGGLLLPSETAEETLVRKLKEIIGNSFVFFEQFHTFTDPARDPRIRTVSIGFIALVSEDKITDASNFQEVSDLPKTAFDHKVIIEKALEYLQRNLDHQFAMQFLPKEFPLNDLQTVYEVVGGKKLDNRNFRKKILDSGLLKKVSKIQKAVSHRPASLYQYKKR